LTPDTLYIGDPSPSLPPPNEVRRGVGDVGVAGLAAVFCSVVVDVFGAAVDISKNQFPKVLNLEIFKCGGKDGGIYTGC